MQSVVFISSGTFTGSDSSNFTKSYSISGAETMIKMLTHNIAYQTCLNNI